MIWHEAEKLAARLEHALATGVADVPGPYDDLGLYLRIAASIYDRKWREDVPPLQLVTLFDSMGTASALLKEIAATQKT